VRTLTSLSLWLRFCASKCLVVHLKYTSNFVATRWTLVLRAGGHSAEARAALSELCEAYYQPVYRFLCREGRDEDAARELAQEFFARILQRGGLGDADPGRGRFRSYLLGAVKHFLADERKHRLREKRGSGAVPESLDIAPTEDGSARELADQIGTVPDAWFDRQWALTVMERALAAVEKEFETGGKLDQFALLKPWLVGADALPQAEVARQLGLSESAAKVAIHRLRKRFREVVRSEVAQTLEEGANIAAEIRYLVHALTQSSP
jgi:RNA polymerase sigma factor (sigma-70 family)